MSAVRNCLFILFAATLHIGGRSSIRNLRTRHAVVTDPQTQLVNPTEMLNVAAESRGLIRVCYWSHTTNVHHSTLGEGMLIGDALLRMQGGELQSAAVAGNGSVLVRLGLGRSHGCAGYGQPTPRHWLRSGVAV